MNYIIQENMFREYHFKTLIEYLERYSLLYEVIPYKPFTNELEFKTKEKNVFVFGSVNLARVAQKYGWYPGSFYNENHNIEIYGKHYDILNNDGYYINVSDELPDELPDSFFARPTMDTKTFSGQLFTKDNWNAWVGDLDDSNLKQSICKETRVQVAPLKTIQQEIRCWIVKGKVITVSEYKVGNRVKYVNRDNDEEVFIFAQGQVNKFQVADAFVMDICLCEDEYKVLEINNINSSGFYDLNMSKLIQSLEENFNI